MFRRPELQRLLLGAGADQGGRPRRDTRTGHQRHRALHCVERPDGSWPGGCKSPRRQEADGVGRSGGRQGRQQARQPLLVARATGPRLDGRSQHLVSHTALP
ncbi:hypothetical protein Y900_021800 [Mycolicibacterium aromaticivorans JS19b1 = JCM 16368]|uniref:Uncharacterized protein n=1 Tax=Mycolicibacterium aromaticivorans JS19b1 = JCM 16368 TaxID=1440774 RepID=A0A064CRN6_9MYCO|nr:hypothetical protein Y900_021800 [Mycolicibacterium aromaticivorans JS19b1 = JCM 16368]